MSKEQQIMIYLGLFKKIMATKIRMVEQDQLIKTLQFLGWGALILAIEYFWVWKWLRVKQCFEKN